MKLERETIEAFGYSLEDCKEGSTKKIKTRCMECGEVRTIKFCQYSQYCRKCSYTVGARRRAKTREPNKFGEGFLVFKSKDDLTPTVHQCRMCGADCTGQLRLCEEHEELYYRVKADINSRNGIRDILLGDTK